MSGVITGDWKLLRELRIRFAEFARPGFRVDLNDRLGAAAIHQVGVGFEQATDPYGRGWKPTTTRLGKTLRDTGRLQNSYHYGKPTSSAFTVSTSAKYAATHQYGAVIKPTQAAALSFWVPGGYTVFGSRGKRLKRARISMMNHVFAKKVVIPQRQMVPENTLGPLWSRMLDEEVDAFMAETMGR